MATLGKMVIELVGDVGGFVSDMDKAQAKLSNVGGNMMRVGAGLTAGVTAPIVGLGAAVLEVGNQYDGVMDAIRTTTGATGETLTALGEDARAVFRSIPTDMQTAGDAVAQLNARTGQTGQGLQNLAAAEIELARITGGDLASQIQNTTRLFGDWGITAQNQVPALDALMRAHQQTGTSVDQLAGSLVKFGAPLRQMGFDFESSAALVGKFEKEGVNAELVLGSLRIALGKMAKAGVEPKEGLKALVAEIKNAGSVAEANKLAIAAFGARAGPDMAAAIREGRFEVGALFDQIKNGKDTVLGAAADTNDYAEKFQVLKNKVTDAAIPLGVTLFGAINNLMPTIERVVGFVAKLIDGFAALPAPVQSGILAFVAIIAALGPVIGVIGGLISAISAIGPIIAGVGAVVTGALAPVLAIIAAVIAVGALLYLAWKNNFLGFRDVVTAIWEAIKRVFDNIKTIVQAVVDFLSGKLSFEEMKAKVTAAWENIRTAIATAIERIVAIVGPIWQRLKQLAEAAWEGIKTGIIDKITALWQALVTIWENIRTAIATKIQEIWQAIVGKFEEIRAAVAGRIEAIRDTIKNVFEGIVGTIGDVMGKVVAKISESWDKVKGFVANLFGRGGAQGPETVQDAQQAAALAQQWKASLQEVQLAWQTMQTAVTGIANALQTFILGWLMTLLTQFQTQWTAIQLNTNTTWLAMQTQIGATTTALEATLTTWLSSLVNLFTLQWTTIRDTVTQFANQMRDNAAQASQQMADQIKGILDGLVGSANAAGSAIGNGVAAGIRSSTSAAVSAAQALAAAVNAYLPHSDAKKGPLSTLTASGRSIPATLAKGIGQGVGTLTGALASIPGLADLMSQFQHTVFGGKKLVPARPATVPAAATKSGASVPLSQRGRQPEWPYPGRLPDVAKGTHGNDVPNRDTRQTINVTINNPVGQPSEGDIVRQLRNLAYVGVLNPTG